MGGDVPRGPRVVEGGCGFFFFQSVVDAGQPKPPDVGAASRERDTHAHTGVL